LRALEPHQRSVHDSLFRLTHELVRNLVDAETAVGDIVHDYHEDCLWLLENQEDSYKKRLEEFTHNAMSKQKGLAKRFRSMAKHLEKDMKYVELSDDDRKKQNDTDDALNALDGLLQEFA